MESNFGNWLAKLMRIPKPLIQFFTVLSAFSILLFSCNQGDNTKNNMSWNRELIESNGKYLIGQGGIHDTLKSSGMRTDKDACLPYLKEYYKQFGVLISKYYTVIDYLPVKLNDDIYIDTIVILSPLSLLPVDNKCDFSFDANPRRLLVEIINMKKNTTRIRNVYSNLLSNHGGVLSKYSGIFKTENGFKLVHESGSNYSWRYETEFSSKSENITLVKIHKTCSFEGNDDREVYHYNNKCITEINIQDTISSQCDCDSAWAGLERKK